MANLTTEITASPRGEELLGQLLTCVAQRAGSPPTGKTTAGDPEVLFDLWLDGARYTLTRTSAPPVVRRSCLSPREKEIVRLICAGLPNKTISLVLQISPGTVGTYLKRIFAKLQVGSRAEMVARVLQGGLLEQSGLVAALG
jgi:DNA-binding CsgD family transcriptional regulator